MMPGDQSRGKKKKKAVEETRALSWQEKKELADREEEDLEKEVEQLITWVYLSFFIPFITNALYTALCK